MAKKLTNQDLRLKEKMYHKVSNWNYFATWIVMYMYTNLMTTRVMLIGNRLYTAYINI